MMALNEFLEWANAGGTVTLPLVLIYGLRYMAVQLRIVQEDAHRSQQQTVELLTGVVRDATLVMRDVRYSLDRVNGTLEHNRSVTCCCQAVRAPNPPGGPAT